ncbi:MAG: hypothetical protein E6J69_02305 [Deltaproteobacteria bacterium]|nr:MAG: hypothetical protein E6J69_02305 [Deltaproteobacteria bacterium]
MIGRCKKTGSGGRRLLLSTLLGLGILASALEGVSAATDYSYYCHTVANSYCGQYYHNGWTPTCLWLGRSDGSSRDLYQKRADGSFPRIGTVHFTDANGDAFNDVSFYWDEGFARWSYISSVTLYGYSCWKLSLLTTEELVSHGFSAPQISPDVFSGGFSPVSTSLGYGGCTIPGCD